MMPDTIRIVGLVMVCVYYIALFHLLKRQDLSLKYSLLWMAAGVVLLVIAIYPHSLSIIARLMGMQLASNTIFLLTLIFVIAMLMTLTVVVSHSSKRVRRLIQQNALLEKRVRELEERVGRDEK